MDVADFSALVAAVASASPWVLLVAIVLLFAALIIVGGKRKWYVWGWFFEDVEKRLKTSIETNEQLSATNTELVDIITTALIRRGDWVWHDDGDPPRPQRRSSNGQGHPDRAPRR